MCLFMEWEDNVFKTYMNLLLPFLKKGKKLLDIGCHTARLFDSLPRFIDYYGVDIDSSALEEAKKKGANVRKVNVEKESKLEEVFKFKFDIIVANHILEHIRAPEKFIVQAKSLLVSKEGVILITVPNSNNIYKRLLFVIGKGIEPDVWWKPRGHIYHPTYKQMKRFLERYFEILDTAHYLRPPKIFLRIMAATAIKLAKHLAEMLPSIFASSFCFLCRLRRNK